MSTDSEAAYFNKSAYVALTCLIAFVIVITICVIKQFIWDPLLSKRFEILRPVLSESVRRFSSSFYGSSSARSSSLLIHKSLSDACVTINDPPLLSSKNMVTVTQSLPATDNQYYPENKNRSRHSYGSSSVNAYSYINYGSEELNDEQINSPLLYFSCEYNPTTFSLKLSIQNLRNMNIFNSVIKPDAYIFIRFTLTDQPYQTSLQHYQDFIRFGETFTILNNIRPGDETIYSIKEDYLTYVLYVERTVPIDLKFVQNETNK
jgi:hypothetical protein